MMLPKTWASTHPSGAQIPKSVTLTFPTLTTLVVHQHAESATHSYSGRATMPDWDAIIPNIFTDTRFHQTGRARFQINIDGTRAGMVVAWRTANFDNHALNVDDFEKLLELKRANKFEAAFVVAATRIKYSGYGNRFVQTYVNHADAENFSAKLNSMPLNGPFGLSGFCRNSPSAIVTLRPTMCRTDQTRQSKQNEDTSWSLPL
jgi:hypothetical protein